MMSYSIHYTRRNWWESKWISGTTVVWGYQNLKVSTCRSGKLKPLLELGKRLIKYDVTINLLKFKNFISNSSFCFSNIKEISFCVIFPLITQEENSWGSKWMYGTVTDVISLGISELAGFHLSSWSFPKSSTSGIFYSYCWFQTILLLFSHVTRLLDGVCR